MHRVFLIVVFLLSLGLANATEPGDDSVRVLQQALHAMQYATSLKAGFAEEKRTAAKTTPFIEAVLSASERQVEQVCARVLAPRIKIEDSQYLLAFYSSPAGKRLVADQAVDPSNPSPPLRLSTAQIQEARSFSSSPAVARFREVAEDRAVQAEIARQLKAVLLK